MKPWTRDDIEKKDEFYQQQLEKHNPAAAAKYKSKRAGTVEELFPELAGRSFQSKLERNHAVLLVLRLRAKEIRSLEFQRTVYLSKANISYRTDFVYREKIDGKWRFIVDEAKGKVSDRFRVIVHLWGSYGPKFKQNGQHYGKRNVPMRIYIEGYQGTTKLQRVIWPK